MAEIAKLLDDVIEKELKELSICSSGSDKEKAVVHELETLHKMRIDEIKVQAEVDEIALKKQEVEKESESQKALLKEQRIDRVVKIGVATAELILPLVFYGAWMMAGFKFEETGAFTSTTFKNLFNRFKPTK